MSTMGTNRTRSRAEETRGAPDLSDRAACRDYPAQWWTPPSYSRSATERAKRICGGCPVAAGCLDYAEQTGQTSGIWGGMTPKERAQKDDGIRPQDPSTATPPKPKPTRPKSKGRRLQPIPHGTTAGYRRHLYRSEPACEDCLAAERESSRAKARAARHPCRCGHTRRQHHDDRCVRRACGCARYRPAPEEGAAA